MRKRHWDRQKRLTGEYKWLRERERLLHCIMIWLNRTKYFSTILCENLLKNIEWNAIFSPLVVPGLRWGMRDPSVVVCEQHVGSSSLTRDWTQPPKMRAQGLSQWTTREVPKYWFLPAPWSTDLEILNTRSSDFLMLLLRWSYSSHGDTGFLRPQWGNSRALSGSHRIQAQLRANSRGIHTSLVIVQMLKYVHTAWYLASALSDQILSTTEPTLGPSSRESLQFISGPTQGPCRHLFKLGSIHVGLSFFFRIFFFFWDLIYIKFRFPWWLSW